MLLEATLHHTKQVSNRPQTNSAAASTSAECSPPTKHLKHLLQDCSTDYQQNANKLLGLLQHKSSSA
jgi:hypothetical protein